MSGTGLRKSPSEPGHGCRGPGDSPPPADRAGRRHGAWLDAG